MPHKPIDHRRREPAPGVFRLVLPLPFPGLDRVNAYLIADEDGSTLVDCGIRDPSPEAQHGWDHLVDALAACDHELAQIKRLVITHPHIDHYGLAGRVVEASGCELWMHRASEGELEELRDPKAAIEKMRAMLAGHVASPEELEELTSFEDWQIFIDEVIEATHVLDGGEIFTAGGRPWYIVHVPGHSPAHICVWNPDRRVLMSGDHLLPTITPHIDYKKWEEPDPLGRFLESLHKVENLNPSLVLPGHGRPFEEGAERARVIARHHDRRLGAILQVIRHEPHSTAEITDALFGTTLLNFQRRLALGEALAHLAYLRKRGEIERIEGEDGRFLYVKAKRKAPSDEDE